MEYTVEIVIEAKPALADPEGETIKRDLLAKHGFEMVAGVRTAKLIRLRVNAKGESDAVKQAERMVNELRLANPVAQSASVKVVKGTDSAKLGLE